LTSLSIPQSTIRIPMETRRKSNDFSLMSGAFHRRVLETALHLPA
jgi:hypothetical protein